MRMDPPPGRRSCAPTILPMTRRTTRWIVLAIALTVLAAGSAYAFTRHVSYESTASVVLVPTTANAADLAAATDSFAASGTAGTFVELLGAPDTLRAAGSPPIELGVRAVPDSRVIGLTAHGARVDVQPALQSLLDAAQQRQDSLHALWRMNVLAEPSDP